MTKKEYNKKYYSENREKILQNQKEKYQQNKEEIQNYNKEWYRNNKEQVKEYQKQNKDHLQQRKEKFMRDNPGRVLLWWAKNRAKKKAIPFDLGYDDIVVPEFCPVLGIRLAAGIGNKKRAWSAPSLDRIKPELGYVKGNIIVMSLRANVLKNNASIEELKKLVNFLEDLEKDSK